MTLENGVEADLPAVEHTLEEHWGLFLMEGVALIVLGAGAILVPVLIRFGFTNYWVLVHGQLVALPQLTGIVIAILFGWLLLMSGVFGIVTTLTGRHAPGFWWSLLSSTIAMGAGAVLFLWPGGGVFQLSWVLTAFLGADGIVTVMLAMEYRRAFHVRWRLLLISGLVDLVLAAIILVYLRNSAITTVAPVMGIDFLFGGASVVGLSLAARTNARQRAR